MPTITFPKSFPRSDKVRELIEFGAAGAPEGTEIHVKSRPLRHTWHVEGFGVGFSTRAAAARAFPGREPYPLTDWGPYFTSGYAYVDAVNDEMTRLQPDSLWLFTLTIPTPEAYSANSWPYDHVYPGKRSSSAPWPHLHLSCWQEDVVSAAAHEAQHLVQFRDGLPHSEMEAEEAALDRLREWQSRAS